MDAERHRRLLFLQDCVGAQLCGVDASAEYVQASKPLGNPRIERFAAGPGGQWVVDSKAKRRDDALAIADVHLATLDASRQRADAETRIMRKRRTRRRKGSKGRHQGA